MFCVVTACDFVSLCPGDQYASMNIYITGFMGTGKSSVGRELAHIKKWQFLDLDDLIEEKEGLSIPDIFKKKGESCFRQAEKKALAEASRKKDHVIACGGGIVIDPENINVMKQTGFMVCLTASPEVILARTRQFSHRPLLNVADQEAKIHELLQKRAPFYAQAQLTIDTSLISIQETARKILQSV